MDEASLGLSRELLIGGLNNSLTEAYYSYMVDIAVIFGAEQNRAETELRESLNFEISLANVSIYFIFAMLFIRYKNHFHLPHRFRYQWRNDEIHRNYTIH